MDYPVTHMIFRTAKFIRKTKTSESFYRNASERSLNIGIELRFSLHTFMYDYHVEVYESIE